MKKLIFCIAAVLSFAGCSSKVETNDGKTELNVKVDTKDTTDKLKRNLEKAGEEIKDGANKAKDKLEEAGQAVKDKFDTNDNKKAQVKVEVKKD